MSNKQIMVDLETMSTEPNAAIVAIGAVRFDVDTRVIDGEDFYVVIDLNSCTDIGMDISPSTIEWWMKQSDAARNAIFRPTVPVVEIAVALRQFSTWYGHRPGPIWGNGAASDNVWLTQAYKLAGEKCPWTHREDRCFRTMKAMYPDIEVPSDGLTAHNALHDAIWQTKYLLNILAKLPEGHSL